MTTENILTRPVLPGPTTSYVASTTPITCPHLDDGVDWQAFNKWAFSSVLKINSASVLM